MDIDQLYHIFKECTNICTDTRQIAEACLFWGLKGENHDGAEFCEEALSKGARYALRQSDEPSTNQRIIHVTDSLKSLQELARYHRNKFGIPILAITGSNGKTTTKELINCVLSANYKTHCTKGNFNNHIGVPLTLLSMPSDTEVAVIEMGANHQGEIMELCRIAEPTCGLITNIGKAHLEGFGGVEGVKKGKSELFQFLNTNGGLMFVNADEPEILEVADKFQKKIIFKRGFDQPIEYFSSHVDVESEDVFLNVSFNSTGYGRITIKTHLIGTYNFNNLMASIVVGQYFKVPDELIKRSLENYIPTNNRSQIVEFADHKIVLDAYNANPSSMVQALSNFKKLPDTKKIVILGDMFELGEYSSREHQEIADFATDGSFQLVVLIGGEFLRTEVRDDVLRFTDVNEALIWYKSLKKENTSILIKGSRGMKLERLVS